MKYLRKDEKFLPKDGEEKEKKEAKSEQTIKKKKSQLNASNLDVMSSINISNSKAKPPPKNPNVLGVGLPPSGNTSTKVSHTLDQRASVSNR
jgi:hypothetical protein